MILLSSTQTAGDCQRVQGGGKSGIVGGDDDHERQRHGALERRLAAGVLRQHHLDRHECGGLLHGRTGGHRAIPRDCDSQTKTVAKPQLRGTEGQKVTLNLGEEVPVPSTTFTPIATGGASANPLSSVTYRPIGVIVEMTPRVTYEGDIVMDLTLENSARGQDSNIAGQVLPAFASQPRLIFV